jgi:hypothetical protein
MATKFTKGQPVKFDRNAVTKSASTIVAAIVPMFEGQEIEIQQSYIIEYTEGWIPNSIRINQFELDVSKKYLFVSENELTSI